MSIIRSKLPDVNIPDNVSYNDFVFQYFDIYGDRPALIDALSGRTLTFFDLKDKTRRFSSALAKRGFKKGDVIAIYLPNVIEYPIIVFGAVKLGGISTLLNPQCSQEELSRLLKISKATFLVTTPPLAEKALSSGVLERIRSVFVIGRSDNFESVSTLLADDGTTLSNDAKINPREDVAALLFSSGTTGVSKGVMLTHYNLIASCRIGYGDVNPREETGTVLINVLPPYHIFGFSLLCCGRLYAGVKLVLLARFEPHVFLQAIQDYKVTSAMLVPPLVLFLAQHPLVKKFDLSSLKVAVSGGASLSGELGRRVVERITSIQGMRQGFGMTELTGGSHVVMAKIVPGSVGLLSRNLECKIIDPDTSKILGPNKDGELCIRGPTVMKGYLDNPEATAQTIDSDGWLHTGDIAYYDEDEHFFIVGRIKELIKYKGFQVPPAEIEALLTTHPNILDAAVVGVSNLEAGELPKAYVVRRGNITSAEIMEFVAKKVQPQKKLRGGVEFVSAIPKSPSGKILRRLLRKKETHKSHL